MSSMARAFAALESSLRPLEFAETCGSTALVAVVDPERITLGWLGDSGGYLFRAGYDGAAYSAVELVDRHYPGRADEAARIAAAGGKVDREKRMMDSGEEVAWGPLRVFFPGGGASSGVTLSRALGCFSLRRCGS